MKKEKNWEWVLAIVLLLVVFAVVTPTIVNIVYKAQVDAATSSADAVMRATETMYTEKNLIDVVSLPLEVKYENEEYTIYSDGKEIKSIEIKVDGKEPKSGSVIINKDGSRVIKDLTLGLVVCNKEAEDSEMTCKWSI